MCLFSQLDSCQYMYLSNNTSKTLLRCFGVTLYICVYLVNGAIGNTYIPIRTKECEMLVNHS